MRRAAVLVFAWLLLSGTAEATKYWYGSGPAAGSCAAASGTSDPGVYLSWAATWTCMSGGDTFHIKAGTYAQRIPGSAPAGTVGSPTIVEGEGATGCGLAGTCNTTLTLDNSNIGFGLNFTGNFTVRNLEIDGTGSGSSDACIAFSTTGTAANIILDNVELHHCGGHGIFTQPNVNTFTARNFWIHHTNQINGTITGHGCYLEGDDTLLENFIISNIAFPQVQNIVGCQIYDSGNHNTADRAIIRNGTITGVTGSHALFISGADAKVYNMLIYGNLRGIEINSGNASDGGCNSGGKIYNNVIYNNTLGFQFGQGNCNGTVDISNNIIYGNTTSIDFCSGCIPALVWSSSGSKNAGNCGSSCGSSPVLIVSLAQCTVSTSDFHLNSASTPCNDTGADLSSTLTTDNEGTTRPQGVAFDIGAYEYPVSGGGGGGGSTPGQPRWSPASNLRLASIAEGE